MYHCDNHPHKKKPQKAKDYKQAYSTYRELSIHVQAMHFNSFNQFRHVPSFLKGGGVKMSKVIKKVNVTFRNWSLRKKWYFSFYKTQAIDSIEKSIIQKQYM